MAIEVAYQQAFVNGPTKASDVLRAHSQTPGVVPGNAGGVESALDDALFTAFPLSRKFAIHLREFRNSIGIAGQPIHCPQSDFIIKLPGLRQALAGTEIEEQHPPLAAFSHNNGGRSITETDQDLGFGIRREAAERHHGNARLPAYPCQKSVFGMVYTECLALSSAGAYNQVSR